MKVVDVRVVCRTANAIADITCVYIIDLLVLQPST